MNFLGPENLYRITRTAPEPVQIGSFALCEILVQQRKLRPHGVAVEAWDGDFTYGELYDLSRRMAARLLQLGVHEEERIGICMRKSKWSIVAFWGILMAGCTGVPLNIRNPPKRTETLLRRVNARYLVTDQCTETELDGLDIGILHCSSEMLEKVDGSCPELRWPRISPWTEAFIMFTSGSTGLPKGVVVEHGPLYTKMMEIPAAISLDERSKVFQFSDFIFDGAFADIFATMAAGGCVCIPSEEERLNNVSAVLQRSRATHIFIPNSVLAQIKPKDVPHLRHLTVGGEILTKESIQRWSPRVQMISVYGITETIVFDSYASSERLATDYCNIGLAKGNCLWVTDPNDLEKLKPIGAVGEILVEGPLLAKGYMDDIKRTMERFVPAPLWLQELRGKQQNHRCFRSGDYGIRNADGTVSYVCRADAQVKLGGQRVELGEIEHSLCVAEPMLDQIAVEVVKLQSRENRQMLVAFVKRPPVEADGSSPLMPMDQESKRIMRSAQSKLLESLSRYMVPSVYIPIQDIPKSATGKRDRKTLQSWGSFLTEDQLSQYQLRDSAVYRSPVTWEEKLLQRLWAQILRAPVASLSTNDNFFQVGGDSIKAIELVQALRESGRVLTVSQIFKHPEMREAAQLLGNVDRKAPEEVLPQPFELIPNSVARVDCVQEAARVCNVNVDMVEDIYPTTPMQEALIAISAHRSNVYTHRVVFRLPKSLDMERFKKAWAAMVSQQSIFRTRIVTLHGVGTVQVVLRSDMNWQAGMTLEEFVQHDEKKSVTYGSALSRYAIVHDEQGTLYFVWSGHHAISDGWSRTLMYKEINQIYNHGVASQETSYTPFIQYINALDLEEADQFWSEQFPDTVESFPCLPSPEYTPDARQMQPISLQLNRKATSSITTATLVQAAWALVTAAYAGTDDAIFGLTLSGRDTFVPGITSMMGITITTVPVRVILDNTSTISEYLENVSEYVSQVRQHQHIGLQRICRLSPEARSAGGFQNLLVIQPVDEDEGHQGMTDLGLELVHREENDTLDYALTVQCTIDGDSDSLHIKAHYDENVISKKQIECLLHLFDHIIKQLATESTSRSLYDLDKVSPHDLGLFSTWNAQMPAPVEKTIHGLFEEQTRLAPNAVALDGVHGPLTYAELDILSNRLASHIQQQTGVLLESRVMLCFRKSNIPIIAMLATLKIGGVCVSINPEHPASRLLELSSDVESRVVLCGEDDVEQFTGHIPHVVCVTDTLLAQLRSEPVTKAPLTILPSNAAFIVYTSGSTGKPKGSVIEHRSLATHLAATGQQVGLDTQSRTLQFSSYTFDCHLLEIFGTLIHGGCVQVISDHERMNFLSEVIDERQINFAVLTKTVSRLLEPENVPTLKTLILTGEPNGRQDYWRWAKQLRLFNGLGPSECTPLACLTRGPVAIEDDPANIGHAVGCQIWIVDHRRPDRLVPVGCVGELIVEGPIVGRGYANRPKESAASFIQNLAWSRDGSGSCRRFYRSGDLAKMNVDGSITFVGRADSQIKIHGQRVELGEIEDHLRRCSAVFTTSAVDTFQTTNRGDATVLVVFCSFGGNRRQKLSEDDGKDILPIDEKSRSAFKAQTQLSNFLPRYMVPSIFIPVRHLPFNTSGKLERKVLRKWAAALNADDLGQYYLANPTIVVKQHPTNGTEISLQLVWSQILNRPLCDIGMHDTFTSLGGDSITAMQIVSECRRLGIMVRVVTILMKKTIADISPHCTFNHSFAPGSTPIVADGPSFNLAPIQKLYFKQESQNWTCYNQAFLCRVKKGVSVDEARHAFDIIVARHAMLRVRFRKDEDGSKWTQYTVPPTPGTYRFQSHSLGPIQNDTRDTIAASVAICSQESISSIDITQGPIFSVDYFDVAGNDSMMYLVAHHLVIDLVSWRIIWRDFEEIIRNGSLPGDLSPSLPFQNWVSLQEQCYGSTEMSPATVYPPLVTFAPQFDFWGVSEQDNILEYCVEQSFSLSPHITSLILGKGNQALRTTPLDIIVGHLVHSFQHVFQDRATPPVFIEHHGREQFDGADDIDLSQTVGWFTAMYPVNIPVNQSATCNEAIRLAKDTRNSIPGNGQPYFAFRHLSPDGDLFVDHAPVEILVNFLGIFQQLETSDGLIQLETRVSAPEQESASTAHRFAMIDLSVGVSHGVMDFTFTTHKQIAHGDRVREWISLFQDSLTRSLPKLAVEAPTYTLSDFPRLKLTYEDLQDLLSNKLPIFKIGIEQHGGIANIIEDIYPCTAMQGGILLSQQTDNQVYLGRRIWEFTSDSLINENLASRLEEAWKTVVKRHASLRTGIIEHATDHSHFLQVVLKSLPSSRFVKAKAVIGDVSEISNILEPDEDSFWMHVPRLTMYQTKNNRVACSLKLSHVLMDGMSLDVFMKELIGMLSGRTLLPSAAMDFGRYIDYEQSANPDQTLEYWTGYLRNVQPCHIPIQEPQNIPTTLQEYGYIQVPEDTTAGLVAFCRRLDITPAVLIQTAWAIVLGAFTGQDDVCFGYLASGRDAPIDGIEESTGLFISMQVCRVRLEGMVNELLQGVHHSIIAGLEHRNCSLALIQSALGFNEMPLFNTCIAIRRAVDDEEQSKMDSLVRVVDGAEKTEFTIALGAAIGTLGAEIGITYQKSKISPKCAESITGSLAAVIRSLLKVENQNVHEVELIGTEDRELTEQWNTPPEMVNATLHSLVEERVREAPNAIAISGFDGEYTYAQLNAMAEKLAVLLVSRGVRLEDRVVLCFTKSAWPIVAMLAILKAGGVCVSTNADHPTSRQLDICADVNTTVVLCDETNAVRFRGHAPHVIVVDVCLLGKLDIPTNWLAPLVKPTNAAFVVYTSGSTGKPKGCVLEHHSVSKSQLVNAKAMNITKSSRAVQFASYSFDASICEIFAPLVTGACVCVVSDNERLDDLAAAIDARKADWIMLTPTVARLFSPSAVPTLRTLVFGGEALSREAIEIWRDHVHLVNYWGPSECANSGCLNSNITLHTSAMNIGRASGCNIWITEQKSPHRLAPIGCVGELLVEGPMLGREYINRPEATAAAYVTDLAWSRGRRDYTRRFYRTGDMGRFNPDGSVTFVGRADNQVKIHGQRVELDEIKHQIMVNLPSGSEVVVDVSVGGQSKKPTLVAFVKLDAFSSDATDDMDLELKDSEKHQEFQVVIQKLEKTLAEVLPQYMIPSTYIPITKVPTTLSAKTDRKLLKEFACYFTRQTRTARQADANKKQPASDIERDLQAVWAQILNHPVSKIGIDDTFMSLGGDSMSAMRAVAQCRKLGIKVPVSVILQKKTITAIAPRCVRTSAQITQVGTTQTRDDIPFQLSPIQKRIQSKDNIEDIFPLSPFQKYAVEANFDDPPRQWSCFYFELPSNVNHARLQQTCVKLVEQHPTLRTLFINHTSGFLQVVLKSLQLQVESYKSDDDITVFTDRVFHDDLATQPLPGTPFLRFIIISTPTHTRLLMRLSHAQFDGFSRTIFVRNLAALYSGQQCPESVSYSRFIRHAQQQHQKSCRYWQSALAGAKPTIGVQITTPSPFADNGVIRIDRTIPPFRTLEGVTPATVFNAACAIVLRSLTSSDDVTFGRITSGRAALDDEFQDLVGPCTNIVPIRVRFPDGPSQLSYVLQLIHKQYVESIPHETIGLDDIIRDCTNWSTSMAQFPVVTQYFNLEEGSEAHTSGDGDAECSVHVWDPVRVDPFPWSLCLGAFPSRAGVRISIAANSRYAERGMVERVVDELCAIINGIGNSGGIKGRG
ncbi:hypothetical protein B0O99DRAFT_504970 [Bisporella sp. PMI_857]|nr:hypothetical protein B0O99DRAFT_504970 [Bisporella sp. PMI_857]